MTSCTAAAPIIVRIDNPEVLSFHDFAKHRRLVPNLGEHLGFEDEAGVSGLVYPGDCYIEQEDMDKEEYCLTIGRDSYSGSSLPVYEAILYADWYLHEICGISDDYASRDAAEYSMFKLQSQAGGASMVVLSLNRETLDAVLGMASTAFTLVGELKEGERDQAMPNVSFILPQDRETFCRHQG